MGTSQMLEFSTLIARSTEYHEIREENSVSNSNDRSNFLCSMFFFILALFGNKKRAGFARFANVRSNNHPKSALDKSRLSSGFALLI